MDICLVFSYFLERSHTARVTLAKACQLCPEEEAEDQELTDEQESPQREEEAPITQKVLVDANVDIFDFET